MTIKQFQHGIEIKHESEFLFREHLKLLQRDGYKIVINIRYPEGTYFARLER